MNKYAIGNKVKLPFGETGTIVRITSLGLDWFPYKIKIRKGVFNLKNQIIEFKESQIELEELVMTSRQRHMHWVITKRPKSPSLKYMIIACSLKDTYLLYGYWTWIKKKIIGKRPTPNPLFPICRTIMEESLRILD